MCKAGGNILQRLAIISVSEIFSQGFSGFYFVKYFENNISFLSPHYDVLLCFELSYKNLNKLHNFMDVHCVRSKGFKYSSKMLHLTVPF